MGREAQSYVYSLLSGAIGAPSASPIEFDGRPAIVERYGASAPSEITDDAQMSLFVAEALVRALERNGRGSTPHR